MTQITSLKAREILDSRGNPTIEVTVFLGEFIGIASVPSGASTGSFEAHELRDNETKRFRGKGVRKAVGHVEGEIRTLLLGKQLDQTSVDQLLIERDGTPNKARLGANAILGVSLAYARAASSAAHLPLFRYLQNLTGTAQPTIPRPMFNVINGGKHADSGLAIQEFMIVPVGFRTARETVRVGAEIFQTLKYLLNEEGLSTAVGDEGGFAPHLETTQKALNHLIRAIEAAGYSDTQVKIGLDAAATSFYDDGTYLIDGQRKTADELIAYYQKLTKKYPMYSLEDGLIEDDWEGFCRLKKSLGGQVLIVGDDLTVTQQTRIHTAIQQDALTSVLIKPNQVGTLTETLSAIRATKDQGWTPIISHRSGETLDTFIVDLAVGCACPLLKAGAPSRGERVAKYNRLLGIETELGL